jgi:hypothetical protein
MAGEEPDGRCEEAGPTVGLGAVAGRQRRRDDGIAHRPPPLPVDKQGLEH